MSRDESEEDLSVKIALALSAGSLFFISCMSEISCGSTDLLCYRFHQLQLFDSSDAPDLAFVIFKDLFNSKAFLEMNSCIARQIKITVIIFSPVEYLDHYKGCPVLVPNARSCFMFTH